MPTLVDTTPGPTTGAPSRTETDRADKPTPLVVARALGTVVGGPLLLDTLEVLGPVSAAMRWPHRMPTPGTRRVARVLTALGVAAPFIDHGVVRPWLRRWGATPQERTRRLPGDPDTTPLFIATRAVTVRAPAEEVWRWLVQIGQDRGGFYSYDWLENLAGCDIHSAEEVVEEWQDRKAGDALTVFHGYATPLLEVDPPRALVIENWGAYVIEPIDDASCRLLARSRAERDAAGLAYVLGIELPHAIMERRMLLGIKHRAERARPDTSGSTFWEHARADLQAGH